MQRSFYYWKTVFNLSPKEKQALTELGINKLYVRFFDIDWSEGTNTALPVAKSIFSQSPPANLSIIPVIFITQEPLKYLSKQGLDSLAANINTLLSSITINNHLLLTNEVQVDCDWTQSTKENYFYLLTQLKRQPLFNQRLLSATIRLHQLKFIQQTGVPPVDKGLLMCYNMGNLRHPQTKNSIIDEAEVKKYTNSLHTYPLALDVALPIFDWWILFDGEKYKGLVRDFTPGEAWKDKEQIQFTRDTIINGTAFTAGQWLRHEGSSMEAVQKSATILSNKLKVKELTVILYHLNEDNLAKYSRYELQSFFDSFH